MEYIYSICWIASFFNQSILKTAFTGKWSEM